ncbi:cytochrome c biogenesis protein CcsA [Anaerosinus massiliensis]|uniref:cytochrome c biogenesis protein CcsA n=1 Tax=Massilibacillus massiliensis TaxID=1806837 RepID=UPI000AD53E15|nr:cytochrome c biogenesis protein CcsA [Massilibacillus massiliensis]
MIGVISLFLALITVTIAVFSSISTYAKEGLKKESTSTFTLGSFCYQLSNIFILFTSAFFIYIILTDQFQYRYVWSFSAKDLPLAYKFAAFWAGQEGSFLLWTLLHALIGLYFERSNTMAKPAFIAYMIIQAVLTILLMIKNPFLLQAGHPVDGMGLNPLLQDPWMVIHPPIIFIGYATLAIPFSYALGGLITEKHREWMEKALPWTLFSWSFLGAGIFIGGYWAYKTLGWGGYWGWDPVENSSLVPWLTSCALIHLLITAKIKPGAFKLTYLMAICSFLLVLYGTFLTRSGVLSDFSVHSFSEDGTAGTIATLFILVAVVSLLLLSLKWGRLYTAPIYQKFQSREFVITAGAIAFIALAALILVGMSTPLVSKFLGSPQNVNIEFYNNATLPLISIILALITLTPMLKWLQTETPNYRNVWYLTIPLVIAIVICIFYQIYHPLCIIAILLACTAFSSHVIHYKQLSLAATIAHIGLSVMTIGIILSSAGSQNQNISFEVDEIQSVFGYNIKYLGETSNLDKREKYQNFELLNENTMIKALTKLTDTGDDAAREPGIYKTFTGDVYFAPAHKHDQEINILTLKTGTSVTEDNLTLTLTDIVMERNHTSQNIKVHATFEVNNETMTETVILEMIHDNGQFKPVPVEILDNQYSLSLTGVNAANKQVRLELKKLQPSTTPQIDIDISYKPLIGFVWLGCILITIGCLYAAMKKIGQIKQT